MLPNETQDSEAEAPRFGRLPRRLNTRNLLPWRPSWPPWSATRCRWSPATACSPRPTLRASPPCWHLRRYRMIRRSLLSGSGDQRSSESSMTGGTTSGDATRACLRWQMPRCASTHTKPGNNMNFTPSMARPSVRIMRSSMCMSI
uniref:Uncharacterized protein n=1 Tax=Oryza glaberrima TaxID=4538 RepID=I1NMJ8_ORYGL